MRVRVLPDRDAVANAAARAFVDAAQEAITARGRFLVALAGGRTPAFAYAQLATEPWKDAVDWARVELFWGDERNVSPGHPESNYAMARRTLLAPLDIDGTRVHRMHGEAPDLDAAAREYETDLTRLAGHPPVLDLILLGMGPDGHVASLFPGTSALDASGRFVLANPVPSLNATRLTLTFDAILPARAIVVQVSGGDKADAARRAMQGAADGDPVPARRLSAAGDRVLWLLDTDAAASLPPATRRS